MSTTMDQIHHIREMFYQQDKNLSSNEQMDIFRLTIVLAKLRLILELQVFTKTENFMRKPSI